MSLDTKAVSARAARLISGDFRPDDLYSLFLFLRERSYGGRSVKEIGDFVAHTHERDRGEITDELRSYFDFLFFKLVHWNGILEAHNLDSKFVARMKYGFSRFSDKDCKLLFGISKRRAQKELNRLVQKFSVQSSGYYSIMEPISHLEYRVMDRSINVVQNGPKPLFDGDILFDEFCTAIARNSLLTKDKLPLLAQAKEFVILYAVSVMHNSQVVINQRREAKLIAGVRDGQIHVHSELSFDGGIGPFRLSSTIFPTSLQSGLWTEPVILEDGDWDYPIEVTPGCRISPIK